MNVTEFAKEYFEKHQERQNKVKSKEYLDWIYNFINNSERKGFCDEDFLYPTNEDKFSEIDKENGLLLSSFIEYITEIASKQRVMNLPDEENEFEYTNYVINIEDCYYRVTDMHGQGSISFINKIEKPNYCYVKFN